MAQIPLGSFGAPRLTPTPEQGRVITTNPETLVGGSRAIAGALSDVARDQQQLVVKQKAEDQALARVRASTSIIDRESQLKTIGIDIAEKMRTGELPWEKAEEAYTAAATKLDPIETPGLDEVQRGEVGNSLKRLQVSGMDSVRQAASVARVGSARADLDSRMDMLGKDAALPGASVEQINARMDAEDIDLVGRMAYGEQWGAKKQEFKDGNWTTHATQRVIGARDGLGDLRKIEHDLTADDGYYARKLDPDKRNQLLNTVTGRIFQVQEHQQRQAEVREMAAMRTIDQMDKQAATGIPPTPADQQRWQGALAGTSMAGEFGSRMQQMNQVQVLLRLPVDQQVQFIQQQRENMAQNGASVSTQANVDRLQKAVDDNTKLMQEQPLLFSAQRTGTEVEPLDLAGLGTPEGQMSVVGQLGGRFDIVNAVRSKYGDQVARNPWRPEEAAMLKSFLAQADDGTKLQLLGALAAASPSGSDYTAALKPIAADEPLTMLAGMATKRQLKGADGTDVPKMLLAGAKVLADKSTKMPSDKDLQLSFDAEVGNSIPSGTPQREQAFTAYKALYAGMAGPAGLTSQDAADMGVDSDLASKAIQLATGGISERAGAKVVKPYGWDDDRFDNSVDSQLEGLSASTGFSLGQLGDMPLSGVPGREGSYYLMNAGRIQLDPKTQQPIVVKIQ